MREQRTRATAGREPVAGEVERRMPPFLTFFLLVSILALVLSIGFAVAPGLSRPVGYAPVESGRTAPADNRGSGGTDDSTSCAGPGCAGTATVGTVSPFAGGGSTVVPPPPGATATTASGVAMPSPRAAPTAPAAPTTSGVAGVQVTRDVAGGSQSIAAPAALAASPLLAEVVESYLRCWRERARSYALADPTPLRDVLVEPALGEATGRIARLRAEGRVQWFEDGHAITILAIEGEWAWLVDEYTVGIGAAPSPRPAATPRQSSSPTPDRPPTPPIAPPLRERVRATFTLKRVDGMWKIADSVGVPVR